SALVFVRRTSGGVYWSTPTPPTSADGGALSFPAAAAFPAIGASTTSLMAGGNTFCFVGSSSTVNCTPLYDNQAPVTGFQTSVPVTAPSGTIAELRTGYSIDYGSTIKCLRIEGVPFNQSVYCWGSDVNGVVGVGGPDYHRSPASVSLPGISTLRCGGDSAIAV